MQTQLAYILDTDIHAHGTLIGYPSPDRVVEFTITLRAKELTSDSQYELDKLVYTHPAIRTYLSHDDLESVMGYDSSDFDMLKAFLDKNQIEIVDKFFLQREIKCGGTVKSFESAFNTLIGIDQGADKTEFLVHKSPLQAALEIAEIITDVSGITLDPKIETRTISKPQGGKDDNEHWEHGFSVKDVASAYNFPKEVTGNGQCIGIIELGGRHKPSDIDMFFDRIGIDKPEIKIVGDLPSDDSEVNNGEVSMDIQIAGAIAPDATIVIYYDHTITGALRTIINDRDNCPSVVSISWSAVEGYYHSKQRKEFDQLLYEAALLGITVIGSSGDHGAFNGLKYPNVVMPASHPYVLGCGGSIINIKEGELSGEIVWNEYQGREASGGGYSKYYGIPAYQINAIHDYPYQKDHQRGVPDVAGLASTIDGFQIILDGEEAVVGGTSTATPMWAALIALLNEQLGYRLGFCNNILYHLDGTDAFNCIDSGDNLLYSASQYWDPCTGLGSPNGEKLCEHISKLTPETE